MILDLHRQGLTVSEIARQCGLDRKTVRRYIERGLEPPTYGPRKPRRTVLDPFTAYLRERVEAYPGLTGARLLRELKELGYPGGYTAVTDFLRDVRPRPAPGFEVRFETAPGEQGQVDFAQFQVVFADEPTTPRIVWLFSMVLGYSRLIWARFVMHQDLPTVLRCHVAAFEALGGAPRELLYDRMKTAVIRDGERDGIVYNRALIDLARHYGFHPESLPALSGEDQGQGRAAVPLHPRGLLPRAQLPQSGRPQRPAPALAGRRRQPAPARDHAPGRQRGLRRREAASAALAAGAVPGGAAARAADLARRHGQRRRQFLQRAGRDAAAAWSRCTRWPRKSASSRMACSSPPIPCSRGAISAASRPVIAALPLRRVAERATGSPSPAAPATWSRRVPWSSTTPSAGSWRGAAHERAWRADALHARSHPPRPGRPEDAARAGGARRHRAPPRARRGQRLGSDRHPALRGADACARTAASRRRCAWAAWRRSRRSPGSTSRSSPRSIAIAS